MAESIGPPRLSAVFGSTANNQVEQSFARVARIESTATDPQHDREQMADLEGELARLQTQLLAGALYGRRFTWLAGVLGLVLLGGGVFLAAWSMRNQFSNPQPAIWLGTAGAVVGALIAGLWVRIRRETNQFQFLSEVVSKRIELVEEKSTLSSR